MKYVNIAFDDARSDTYTRAFPILQKYGFTGTINVITEYVNNELIYNFKSSPQSMGMAEIIECQQRGMEIASHGHTHQNNARDIEDSIRYLCRGGVVVNDIGFASPHSGLTEENIAETGILDLLEGGKLSYVRSGVQVRRMGTIYMALCVLEMVTHSKRIFWWLNKENIIREGEVPRILGSVAVKRFTTVGQMTYLINHMNDSDSVCVLFHSILNEGDPGYGKDDYYWDAVKFEVFCQYLSRAEDIKVCTTYEMAKRWQ